MSQEVGAFVTDTTLFECEKIGRATSDPWILEGVASPEDLRSLPLHELPEIAREVRRQIIDRISKTGGHLASSLGAIELISAIHYVFDTPRDRLVLDVGHQGYAHKVLTGRLEGFARIGKNGGIGKFLHRCESQHDAFGAGHAGTSISAATGMAEAFNQRGEDRLAIALIGDGAMTAGMAFEAMNHAGGMLQSNLIVVLNDNGMSIAPNVGALCAGSSRRASANPTGHDSIAHMASAFGFEYVGPVPGHDVDALVDVFSRVRESVARGEGPVLVHAHTNKGHGFEPAQSDPHGYHGVGRFDAVSGELSGSAGGAPKYQAVFADTLVRLARQDERVVGITAAMPDGTSLDRFKQAFPDRFYDVGIAEQHGVCFAAGLAAEGMKPVTAIYSTFLQRAFDQIVHDVCVQNLDVTFAIDRAGLVGADGATHQGIYDIAYLRTLPNIVVMAPKDENELQHMVRTAIDFDGPAAVRFPRGAGRGVPLDAEIRALPIGRAELLREGCDALIVAYGTRVAAALEAADSLQEQGVDVAVLNARFAKPLDVDAIRHQAKRCGVVVTVEEHSVLGGLGSAVLECLSDASLEVATRCLGIPDQVVAHGDSDEYLAQMDLDADGIAEAVRSLCRKRAVDATPPLRAVEAKEVATEGHGEPQEDLRQWLQAAIAGRWQVGRDTLDAMCQYAMSSPGKLLRPVLLLESAVAVGGDPERVLPAAVGTECGHVASLIHDDIIDQDETRRGRESVYKKFGVEDAIVAGDALIFDIFRGLAECHERGVPAERVVAALDVVARSGVELCRGQTFESEITEKQVRDVGAYIQMVRGKTSALFQGACESGALLGGGSDEAVQALGRYGDHLGIAFQVRDDLLAYVSDSRTTGKDATSDIRNRRLTLPVILAWERGSAVQRDVLEDAWAGRLEASAALEAVSRILDETGALVEAGREASRHADTAKEALDVLVDSPSRDRLLGFVDLAVGRRS